MQLELSLGFIGPRTEFLPFSRIPLAGSVSYPPAYYNFEVLFVKLLRPNEATNFDVATSFEAKCVNVVVIHPSVAVGLYPSETTPN